MNTNLSSAIVPKSDQLNSDDLISGPRTITITTVSVGAGEQPVAIHFDGDNGKPWKPCKSMCRVLVQLWGADGKNYAGKSLTLFRDPAVKWAGMEVGGIRISHMSDIGAAMTMALTATRGKRNPFVVKPLTGTAAQVKPTGEMGKQFAAIGVTKAMIEARIGCPVKEATEEQKAELRDVLAKITEGIPVEEFFSGPGDAAE